jgi:hypothetical protein
MISSHIISAKKYELTWMKYILGFIILASGFILITANPSSIAFVIGAVCMTAGICYISYFGQYQKLEQSGLFHNKIIFHKQNIIIGNVTYDIRDLKNLTITFGHYDGEIGASNSTMYTGGIDNRLEFYCDGKKYDFMFYIQSKNHKDSFKQLFQYWRDEKVKFRENISNDAERIRILNPCIQIQ